MTHQDYKITNASILYLRRCFPIKYIRYNQILNRLKRIIEEFREEWWNQAKKDEIEMKFTSIKQKDVCSNELMTIV